jgi:ATP-dependent Zn protease
MSTTDLGISTLLPTIIQFMLIMMIMKMMMQSMSEMA